jgi:hypothetical protein
MFVVGFHSPLVLLCSTQASAQAFARQVGSSQVAHCATNQSDVESEFLSAADSPVLVFLAGSGVARLICSLPSVWSLFMGKAGGGQGTRSREPSAPSLVLVSASIFTVTLCSRLVHRQIYSTSFLCLIHYSSFCSRDLFFAVRTRSDFGFACHWFAIFFHLCCACAGFDSHRVGWPVSLDLLRVCDSKIHPLQRLSGSDSSCHATKVNQLVFGASVLSLVFLTWF